MTTSTIAPDLIAARPRASAAAFFKRKENHALIWILLFVLLQFACQLSLMIDAVGNVRVVLRSAAFLINLSFIVIVPGREHRYRPKVWIMWVIILMALEVAHPLTVSTFAGTA